MPSKRKIGKRRGNRKLKKRVAEPAAGTIPAQQFQNQRNRKKLRYDIGDRVECKLPGEKYEVGTITEVWWRDPSWPPGRVAPYQVRLEKQNVLIFVPQDHPEIIRKPGEVYRVRFPVGHRVLCKISHDPETWEAGVIIAHKFPYPQNPKITMPYQIKLDMGQIIFAPQDTDECIKEDSERLGEPINEDIKYLLQGGKRRFNVGDRVVCKVNPMPEIWEIGTITKVNMPHPSNPSVTLPYQVRLDSTKGVIFAPADSDDVIRRAVGDEIIVQDRELRFTVGDRVECKIHPTEDKWEPGIIMEIDIKQKNMLIPYKINLDNGNLIYAPADREEIIRRGGEILDEEQVVSDLISNLVIATPKQTKRNVNKKDPAAALTDERVYEKEEDFLDLD